MYINMFDTRNIWNIIFDLHDLWEICFMTFDLWNPFHLGIGSDKQKKMVVETPRAI